MSELVYKRMFDQACEDRALLIKAGKEKDKELVAALKEVSKLRRGIRAGMSASKAKQ